MINGPQILFSTVYSNFLPPRAIFYCQIRQRGFETKLTLRVVRSIKLLHV